MSKIYLDDSKINEAGRGVFAAQDIKIGESIEICPVIETPASDFEALRSTILHNYFFIWNKDGEEKSAAICLGFGSLYNHSYKPNATYKKHHESSTIEFVAISDINRDEEITVNYNYGNPNDKSELWITDIPSADSL